MSIVFIFLVTDTSASDTICYNQLGLFLPSLLSLTNKVVLKKERGCKEEGTQNTTKISRRLFLTLNATTRTSEAKMFQLN